MASNIRKKTVTVRLDGDILDSHTLSSSEVVAFRKHIKAFFTDEQTARQNILRLMALVCQQYGIEHIAELKTKYPKGVELKEAIKLTVFITVNDLKYNQKYLREMLNLSYKQVVDDVETIEVRLRHYPDLVEKYQSIIKAL